MLKTILVLDGQHFCIFYSLVAFLVLFCFVWHFDSQGVWPVTLLGMPKGRGLNV